MNGEHPDEKGILNIAASFDRSRQKRGFTSHNGIATVIDLLIGHSTDFDILSDLCAKCKAAEEEEDDVEWKTNMSQIVQRTLKEHRRCHGSCLCREVAT